MFMNVAIVDIKLVRLFEQFVTINKQLAVYFIAHLLSTIIVLNNIASGRLLPVERFAPYAS